MIFIRNMFLKKSFNKKGFLTFNLMVKFIFLSVLAQGCQQLPKLNSAVFYQPNELRTELLKGAKLTNIRDAEPEFSWAIHGEQAAAQQVAYKIELWQLNNSNQPTVMWNSGKVKSARSTAISYMGQPLLANQHYQWRVKVWLTNSTKDVIESAWSQPQTLTMASQLDSGTTRYAIAATPVPANSIKKLPSGRYFIDFGKSAFGYLDLGLTSDKAGDIIVHFGERGNEHGIISDLDKRSSVRYYSVPLTVNAKSDVYRVNPPRDIRNTKPNKAIVIPARFGRIAPFRYIEIDAGDLTLSEINAHQIVVHYPFDEHAAHFTSSDDTLNAVWDLSKYSMKATSFAGVYVDGDRERIPYEADAYINQLSHYLVDSEYSLARYSHEYLLEHPTWPTEWKQHSIMMAWQDWMYTGDIESMRHHFATFKKEKTLEQFARADGLLVSFPDQKVRPPKNRDIVDWPVTERDNFDFKPVNAVINAFHYLNLTQMADMAKALGKQEDYQFYHTRAKQVYSAFNNVFYRQGLGVYLDGEGSTHSGFHANVAALAFGLVPSERQPSVIKLIKEKGMAGSVYFAQYLLEALYLADEPDYALSLMTAKTKRSWYNMIRVGSTITLEAWDDAFKPNQDWNHAWGAVPGNIVGRYVLGVKPLTAGFKQFEIAPQLANLTFAEGKIPTIKGAVLVSATQVLGESVKLTITIPHNSEAKVILPLSQGKSAKTVTVNGEIMAFDVKTGLLGSGFFSSGKYEMVAVY